MSHLTKSSPKLSGLIKYSFTSVVLNPELLNVTNVRVSVIVFEVAFVFGRLTPGLTRDNCQKALRLGTRERGGWRRLQPIVKPQDISMRLKGLLALSLEDAL